LLRVSELVIDLDPLLPRLTAREREARLARAAAALQTRAVACASASTVQQTLTDLQNALAARHAPGADSVGPDLARVAALARQLASACPPG
jgi:hypothetical protein